MVVRIRCRSASGISETRPGFDGPWVRSAADPCPHPGSRLPGRPALPSGELARLRAGSRPAGRSSASSGMRAFFGRASDIRNAGYRRSKECRNTLPCSRMWPPWSGWTDGAAPRPTKPAQQGIARASPLRTARRCSKTFTRSTTSAGGFGVSRRRRSAPTGRLRPAQKSGPPKPWRQATRRRCGRGPRVTARPVSKARLRQAPL